MTTDRAPAALTRRQTEVLHLLAKGLSYSQIAATLYVTAGTVKVHARGLYRRLHATNAASAVANAYRTGILSPAGRVLDTQPALWCLACDTLVPNTQHRYPTHPVTVQVVATPAAGAP